VGSGGGRAGVRSYSYDGDGVHGVALGPSPAAGVRGASASAALQVNGRAVFSPSGRLVVPAGATITGPARPPRRLEPASERLERPPLPE
jgi:hypothetical protein